MKPKTKPNRCSLLFSAIDFSSVNIWVPSVVAASSGAFAAILLRVGWHFLSLAGRYCRTLTLLIWNYKQRYLNNIIEMWFHYDSLLVIIQKFLAFTFTISFYSCNRSPRSLRQMGCHAVMKSCLCDLWSLLHWPRAAVLDDPLRVRGSTFYYRLPGTTGL